MEGRISFTKSAPAIGKKQASLENTDNTRTKRDLPNRRKFASKSVNSGRFQEYTGNSLNMQSSARTIRNYTSQMLRKQVKSNSDGKPSDPTMAWGSIDNADAAANKSIKMYKMSKGTVLSVKRQSLALRHTKSVASNRVSNRDELPMYAPRKRMKSVRQQSQSCFETSLQGLC